MSDRLIQVGDLVQVVRPCGCCGTTQWMGDIFRVDSIESSDDPASCCGNEEDEMCAFASEDEGGAGFPLAELKRIPPLSELEGERTEETLKEPA